MFLLVQLKPLALLLVNQVLYLCLYTDFCQVKSILLVGITPVMKLIMKNNKVVKEHRLFTLRFL